MGLTPEETDAYAKAVVQADFEEAGDADVIRKLAGDLTAANVEIGEAEIRAMLNEKSAEARRQRSEEHTSELQSLMRTSYAVLCLKTKTNTTGVALTYVIKDNN